MLNFFNQYGGQIYLYLLGIIFAGVIAYQIIKGIAPNPYALGYLAVGVSLASHSSGVQQGVAQTNDTVNKTAVAQFPLTPAGIQAQETKDAATTVH
jgi:hypothetical protein